MQTAGGYTETTFGECTDNEKKETVISDCSEMRTEGTSRPSCLVGHRETIISRFYSGVMTTVWLSGRPIYYQSGDVMNYHVFSTYLRKAPASDAPGTGPGLETFLS